MPSYAIVFFSRAFAKRLLDKRFPLATKVSFPTTAIFLDDHLVHFFARLAIVLPRKRKEMIVERFVGDQSVL